jgi:putative flippase GtrA
MIARLVRNAPPWSHEVLRFLVVGGSAFLVDAAILSLMARLGLPPFAARAVSISVALVFTWQMHRRLTFKVGTPATFVEFRRYVGISLVSIVQNYAIFSVMQVVMPPIAADRRRRGGDDRRGRLQFLPLSRPDGAQAAHGRGIGPRLSRPGSAA